MQALQFSEEERRETLRRAQEIAEHRQQATGAEEIESYLRAAEEAGIPRDAVLTALRERLVLSAGDWQTGDMVFAPSADGALYPARVTSLTEHEATVAFVSGGEHVVSRLSLRPFSLVPGRKLQMNEKSWGWIDGTLTSYDADKQRARLSVWSGTEEVKLKDLRLAPERPEKRRAVGRIIAWTALIAGSFGTGLGFLISQLLR